MIRVFVSSVSIGLEATRKQIISDLQTAGYGAGGIHIGLVSEEVQKWGVIGGRQKRSGKEVDVQLWSAEKSLPCRYPCPTNRLNS